MASGKSRKIVSRKRNRQPKRQANLGRFATTTILYLTLCFGGWFVGSDAGVLPGKVFPIPFVKPRKDRASKTCNSASLSSSGECPIPRGGGDLSTTKKTSRGGGADVYLASSTPPLDRLQAMSPMVAPVVGAFLAIRAAVGSTAREFWAEAERTKFLLAGAVAGIVSRTAVSPLEVVATAQMVRGGNKSMWGELSELFRQEGLKGFFKGNGANCLKVAPTRAVQFFAFEQFKSKLVDWKRSRLMQSTGDANVDVVLTPFERLVAGGFAGMIASSMVYPLEVVKTMLTMYPGKYPGIIPAFRGVLTEAGVGGFYKGLAPTLVAMFPYVGVEFMIYESSKIAIEAFLTKKQQDNADSDSAPLPPVVLPTILSLGLGALAGAAAQTSAHPFDVVRKRLQVQGINGNPILYRTTFDCFAGVAAKEGMGALYRGLGPACVATIPGTGVAYIVYEAMKNALGLSSV